MSNEALKKFLSAIARDDYVEADQHFPKVVNSSLKNVINKRKPAILDAINAKAIDDATKAVHSKEG